MKHAAWLIASVPIALACTDDPASNPAGAQSGTGASTSSNASNGAGAGATTSTGAAGSGVGGSSAFVCPPGPFDPPLPANTDAAIVQGGHHFLEGPVWFGDQGVLFFSDMNFGNPDPNGVPPAIIYQLVPPSTITPFIDPIGCNGLAIDPQGKLVACAHDNREVARIDIGTKMRTTIVGTYMGDKFSSPNDAIVRSDGTIYFTDPTWQLGSRPQEIPFKGVYRIATSGEVFLVADDVASPNGIALSPDESKLYVANDSGGQIRTFDVMADGSTTDTGPIATVPGADGMAVDCAGNLYVTANVGVTVLDPTGNNIGTVSVGEKPANCTFGGSDRKTLYITAQTTLYTIDLMVPGLP